jgi:hypothetical protein
MIDIDDEEIEEETLEDRVFEKADYIGEVLTGERKVKLSLPEKERKIQKPKSPRKPSQFKLFIEDFKKSFSKYKNMSLARLIGMSIILILSISVVAFIGYLLFILLATLITFGILGLIGFAIFMCALSGSAVLLLASRYSRK